MAELALLDDDRREVADDDRLAIAEPRGDDDRQRPLQLLPRLGEVALVVEHRRQLDEDDASPSSSLSSRCMAMASASSSLARANSLTLLATMAR